MCAASWRAPSSAYPRLVISDIMEVIRAVTRIVGFMDLAALPGNRFESLKGDRKGQYSIRINDQWRICFEWVRGSSGPANVEIVDYH